MHVDKIKLRDEKSHGGYCFICDEEYILLLIPKKLDRCMSAKMLTFNVVSLGICINHYKTGVRIVSIRQSLFFLRALAKSHIFL